MIIVIGYEYDKNADYYTLFFRNERGFKFRVAIFDGRGQKDFIMCSKIPKMTHEEYTALPDKIEPQLIEN